MTRELFLIRKVSLLLSFFAILVVNSPSTFAAYNFEKIEQDWKEIVGSRLSQKLEDSRERADTSV